MNLENLDESLAEIRQAAKEYYARKSGTWKPKRDLDAERLEDEARFRREAFMSVPWMGRYSSGPEKIIHRSIRPDPVKIGAGKNPMAEHTIRAVKKSHAKRRFSKKSRHGIL